MNIVVPMAGRGSRFVEAGFAMPKPLIRVRGKPMYAWAVDGLPREEATKLIFVCLREQLEDLALENDIRSRYGANAIVHALDHVTAGQACTVLEVRRHIDNDEQLLVFNADTYCPTTIGPAIRGWPATVQGALDVFEAPGDKWSFARVDADDRVLETAEKRRISPLATTGLYWFRHGRDFVRHADRAVMENDRSGNEFYVAPLYNRMIAEGSDIRVNRVPEIWVLGTPEDLQRFEREYAQEGRAV